MEERKRLRLLAKKWKIENDDNFEINYNEDKQQSKEDFKIPSHMKNLKEFVFFGDDIGNIIKTKYNFIYIFFRLP